MIIKHTPDAVNAQTDTDKLPDVEAMIMEKCEELRQLCFNSKRQILIIADAKGRENGVGCNFWNLRTSNMSDVKDMEKVNSDEEENKKAFINLFSMVSGFAMSMSGGQMALANVQQVQQLSKNAEEIQKDNIKYLKALEKIADYDGESIWMDDRDDAANNMLTIARVALGREEENE